MLPPLHTPTPILDATAKLGGGPGLVPATRLPAWLPVPLPPLPVCLLAAAFCPQKTRSPRGLCQASSRCSGARAPLWEHSGHGLGEPQVGGLSSRLTPLPRPGGEGEEVQVHSQRQQQRWCWGGDGRQKEGVGWVERLA